MHDWNLSALPFVNTWTLMTEAFNASHRAVEAELERHDTTLAQLNILLVLDHCEVPLSPGQIASYVFREKHSVSAQVSRMRRGGLVAKTRSKKDQRVVKVKITAKGKELLDLAKTVGIGCAENLLRSCFTVDELQQFDESLRRVRNAALDRLGRQIEPLPAVFRLPRDLVECGVPATAV